MIMGVTQFCAFHFTGLRPDCNSLSISIQRLIETSVFEFPVNIEIGLKHEPHRCHIPSPEKRAIIHTKSALTTGDTRISQWKARDL